jgi:putative hydrolase of the HAD superfamily
MGYSAFVFDFFGVICSEVAPFWLEKYLPRADAWEIKSTMVDAADRGLISQGALFSALAERSHMTPEEVEQEWMSYVRIDEKLVCLVENLRPKFKVGLLTNSPAPFVRRILNEHSFEGLFHSIIVSSEHGCAKPDPAIYQKMLHTLQVDPPSAVMIDDNPKNVAGAIAVGMGGLLFESTAQLESVLPG